jgi:hypothetical protein
MTRISMYINYFLTVVAGIILGATLLPKPILNSVPEKTNSTVIPTILDGCIIHSKNAFVAYSQNDGSDVIIPNSIDYSTPIGWDLKAKVSALVKLAKQNNLPIRMKILGIRPLQNGSEIWVSVRYDGIIREDRSIYTIQQLQKTFPDQIHIINTETNNETILSYPDFIISSMFLVGDNVFGISANYQIDTDILVSKFNRAQKKFIPFIKLSDLKEVWTDVQLNQTIIIPDETSSVLWLLGDNNLIIKINLQDKKVQPTTLILPKDNTELFKRFSHATRISFGQMFWTDGYRTILSIDLINNRVNNLHNQKSSSDWNTLPFLDNRFNRDDAFSIDGLSEMNNRLWVGGHGWVELGEVQPNDETWYKFVLPSFFVQPTKNEYNLFWDNSLVKPKLLFVTDDDRAWYKFYHGNAWFDYQSQQWCWYTTSNSDPIVDNLGNVWQIFDQSIYRYDASR